MVQAARGRVALICRDRLARATLSKSLLLEGYDVEVAETYDAVPRERNLLAVIADVTTTNDASALASFATRRGVSFVIARANDRVPEIERTLSMEAATSVRVVPTSTAPRALAMILSYG